MNAPKPPPIPPIVAIVFGILAVSTASIFIRFAQEEVPSLVIAAWRLTVASLILVPIAATKHKRELLGLSRQGLLLALLSGFFLALHFATWITSLQYTTVASSVVLVRTIHLWGALRGAIAGAGYLLIGRKLRASMSLVSYISVVYGMAAIVLIIIMFAAGLK